MMKDLSHLDKQLENRLSAKKNAGAASNASFISSAKHNAAD